MLEHPTLSYGQANAPAHGFPAGNLLIQAHNNLALKALRSTHAGLVKCVYIDPPYNTGIRFPHYDDRTSQALWQKRAAHCAAQLHHLLADDGSLWVSIDDRNLHRMRGLCDDIFGEKNFVATCIWQKKHTRSNDSRWLSATHDFILCYAKDKSLWRPNRLPRDTLDKGYANPDNDPRGPWTSGPCHAKTPTPRNRYPITTPAGRRVLPPAGTSWRFNEQRFGELVADNRIYFGATGRSIPRYKRFFTDVPAGLVPTTLWLRDEVGDNQQAKAEARALCPADPFATPKPERLLERILTIASNPGDLILDCFAGSGTTPAVAHKMRRPWIAIEIGPQALTHCAPRLRAVIDGRDPLGITKSQAWFGGGAYQFYTMSAQKPRRP